MVTALAAAVGVQVQATDVSQGGFSLEDHWNDTRAPRAIDRGGWHFVVMQQGPSALLSSRENLRLWAGRFNERIRAVGGRPALYMIWPEAARISEFDNVRESYLLAAQDIKGLFLPAGDAWRAAWKREPGLKLYGPDDFHPSVLGTYTAALVITSKITVTLCNRNVQRLCARQRNACGDFSHGGTDRPSCGGGSSRRRIGLPLSYLPKTEGKSSLFETLVGIIRESRTPHPLPPEHRATVARCRPVSRKLFHYSAFAGSLTIHAINTINTNTYNTFNTPQGKAQLQPSVARRDFKEPLPIHGSGRGPRQETRIPLLAVNFRSMEADTKGRRSR